MTEDDEEFLTETYRNLEKRAIGPQSEFYVALEERGKVMGADAARLLGTTVTRTSEGSAFFLTGLRGSGKTVQLKRLKADLEKRGFAVLMFSSTIPKSTVPKRSRTRIGKTRANSSNAAPRSRRRCELRAARAGRAIDRSQFILSSIGSVNVIV